MENVTHVNFDFRIYKFEGKNTLKSFLHLFINKFAFLHFICKYAIRFSCYKGLQI